MTVSELATLIALNDEVPGALAYALERETYSPALDARLLRDLRILNSAFAYFADLNVSV